MLESCSEDERKAALLGRGRDRARRLLCPVNDFSIRASPRRIKDTIVVSKEIFGAIFAMFPSVTKCGCVCEEKGPLVDNFGDLYHRHRQTKYLAGSFAFLFRWTGAKENDVNFSRALTRLIHAKICRALPRL